MDRTALFVDAGYLFAAGSKLIANEKLARGELHLDADAVIKTLSTLAHEITGLPLLRVYWYDGTSTGPTPQQLALAYKPTVKVRLGFVNTAGEQKGVDSLIVTDMINLARNRAMADAVLFTGDEDIRVGVQQAQEFGVRVHLLGIAPAKSNQSGFLVQEADSVRELTLGEVPTFLSRAAPASGAPATASPTVRNAATSTDLSSVADAVARRLTRAEKDAILQGARTTGGAVPSHVDRELLTSGSARTGAQLTPAQKRQLREAFLSACEK